MLEERLSQRLPKKCSSRISEIEYNPEILQTERRFDLIEKARSYAALTDRCDRGGTDRRPRHGQQHGGLWIRAARAAMGWRYHWHAFSAWRGCYEAEDLEPVSSSRHHGGQHRGYYSPPGTSYTIVERPPSAPHHHSSHATPYRSHRGHASGTGAISPEQVLR